MCLCRWSSIDWSYASVFALLNTSFIGLNKGRFSFVFILFATAPKAVDSTGCHDGHSDFPKSWFPSKSVITSATNVSFWNDYRYVLLLCVYTSLTALCVWCAYFVVRQVQAVQRAPATRGESRGSLPSLKWPQWVDWAFWRVWGIVPPASILALFCRKVFVRKKKGKLGICLKRTTVELWSYNGHKMFT